MYVIKTKSLKHSDDDYIDICYPVEQTVQEQTVQENNNYISDESHKYIAPTKKKEGSRSKDNKKNLKKFVMYSIIGGAVIVSGLLCWKYYEKNQSNEILSQKQQEIFYEMMIKDEQTFNRLNRENPKINKIFKEIGEDFKKILKTINSFTHEKFKEFNEFCRWNESENLIKMIIPDVANNNIDFDFTMKHRKDFVDDLILKLNNKKNQVRSPDQDKIQLFIKLLKNSPALIVFFIKSLEN